MIITVIVIGTVLVIVIVVEIERDNFRDRRIDKVSRNWQR